MKRYSKKRQKILDCLRGTDVHPDADWVYRQVKLTYSDVSLGTVYRNLRELTEAGDIRSVGTVHGKERFDGDTSPHTHAVCARCGKIIDVPELIPPPSWAEQAEVPGQFTVAYAECRLVGLCADCKDALAAEKDVVQDRNDLT